MEQDSFIGRHSHRWKHYEQLKLSLLIARYPFGQLLTIPRVWIQELGSTNHVAGGKRTCQCSLLQYRSLNLEVVRRENNDVDLGMRLEGEKNRWEIPRALKCACMVWRRKPSYYQTSSLVHGVCVSFFAFRCSSFGTNSSDNRPTDGTSRDSCPRTELLLSGADLSSSWAVPFTSYKHAAGYTIQYNSLFSINFTDYGEGKGKSCT